ncbi:unnamed protein product [Toxocara canis]|uniref:WH2 domain-containing protein n=1 Tax=Toxocara canis TaxID=6265 RepID=A0A183V5U2_TOXCA|nr:unnamed protein product [Toxocara canis]
MVAPAPSASIPAPQRPLGVSRFEMTGVSAGPQSAVCAAIASLSQCCKKKASQYLTTVSQSTPVTPLPSQTTAEPKPSEVINRPPAPEPPPKAENLKNQPDGRNPPVPPPQNKEDDGIKPNAENELVPPLPPS